MKNAIRYEPLFTKCWLFQEEFDETVTRMVVARNPHPPLSFNKQSVITFNFLSSIVPRSRIDGSFWGNEFLEARRRVSCFRWELSRALENFKKYLNEISR